MSQPNPGSLQGTLWIAPAFEADKQVAVVGLGYPKTRLNYSGDDLDLLAEVADRIGTIVSLGNRQSGKAQRAYLFDPDQSADSVLRSSADAMMATMAANPDAELVKMVEEGLRHLYDYIILGHLPLADWEGLTGESYIERGKMLQ